VREQRKKHNAKTQRKTNKGAMEDKFFALLFGKGCKILLVHVPPVI